MLDEKDATTHQALWRSRPRSRHPAAAPARLRKSLRTTQLSTPVLQLLTPLSNTFSRSPSLTLSTSTSHRLIPHSHYAHSVRIGQAGIGSRRGSEIGSSSTELFVGLPTVLRPTARPRSSGAAKHKHSQHSRYRCTVPVMLWCCGWFATQ